MPIEYCPDQIVALAASASIARRSSGSMSCDVISDLSPCDGVYVGCRTPVEVQPDRGGSYRAVAKVHQFSDR